MDGNNEKLEDLCQLVGRVKDVILQPLQCLGGVMPPEISDVINDLQSELASQQKKISLLQKENTSSKLILASTIADEISATEASIDKAIRLFTAAASVANLQENARRRIYDALSRLPEPKAEYISVTKKQCYETTRTGIQDSIMESLKGHDSRFIWLQGSPGTGKTAIAKSIADSLAQNNRLAASFFWDKTGNRANANSIELFPSSLARQLARFSQDYEMLLVNLLLDRSFRNILMRPLQAQMDSLLIQPMSSLSQAFSSGEGCPVIVLDGLDECGSRDALEDLMKVVVLLDKLPPDFMILVSARPELEIHGIFKPFRNVHCLYTDKISKDDTNHTITLLVQRGLEEIRQQRHSNWVPTEDDLRAFVETCRQLPVLAEVRVREVRISASRGATLRNAFYNVKHDGSLSGDLNDDYLRILRRAYRRGDVHSASHSTEAAISTTPSNGLAVSPDVLYNYRAVVGTVIAAQRRLSVRTISTILAISEEEVRAVLDPIGSIINVPTDHDPVHFYHATAKEFLTDPPRGDENDRAFFFTDVEGAFLALPLLKILNENLNRDILKTYHGGKEIPEHITYGAVHWSTHLDLSSASEELWGDLHLFLTTKLFLWGELIMYPDPPRLGMESREECTHDYALGAVRKQKECFAGINADLPRLLNDIIAIFKDRRLCKSTWVQMGVDGEPELWSGNVEYHHIYRSILPFLPLSSPVATCYRKLSDPIRVVRVRGGNYKCHIPSIITTSPVTPIACATLSDDGRWVALGFCDGVVEVVDAKLGARISRFSDGPPSASVWLLFTDGGNTLVTENSEGDIYILDNITFQRVHIASQIGSSRVMTSLSHDGSMIVRVAQHVETDWYKNMSIIQISTEDAIINALASPSLGSQISNAPCRSNTHSPPLLNSPICSNDKKPGLPLRRSLGFSPDGRYVAAFDTQQAFIWSSSSFQVVAQYSIEKPDIWFLNTNRPSATLPPELPDYVTLTPVFEPSEPLSSLSCVLFTLKVPPPPVSVYNESGEYTIDFARFPVQPAVSRAAGAVPQLSVRGGIWFGGHEVLVIPNNYRDPKSCSIKLPCEHRGFRDPDSLTDFVLPRSRDGTRFLICDEESFPVIVDISGVL